MAEHGSAWRRRARRSYAPRMRPGPPTPEGGGARPSRPSRWRAGAARHRLPWLAALGLSLLALACDERPPEPTRPPPPPAPAAPADEPPPEPTPWPDDVRDLGQSLEAFDDRAGCEARLRAEVPVELAEAFADLRYDAVVEDVCAGLAAAKAEDPDACDALRVTALRRGCRLRAALVAEAPDACPPAAVGTEGRDPLCLAWASRSPALCAGAARRDWCLAVQRNEPGRCRRDAEPARCRAEVQRLGPVIETAGRARRPESAFEATLRVEEEGEEEGEAGDGRAGDGEPSASGAGGGEASGGEAGGGEASGGEAGGGEASGGEAGGSEESRDDEAAGEVLARVDAPEALERGVTLLAAEGERCARVLALQVGHRFREGARVALRATLGPDGSVRLVTIDWAGDRLAGDVPLRAPTLELAPFEARRGAPIRGRFAGSVRVGADLARLRGQFVTHLRDLDPLPAECRAPAGDTSSPR